MSRIHESGSSEAENAIEVGSNPITAPSDDSSSKKEAREKCRIYPCMRLSMLITASSPHTDPKISPSMPRPVCETDAAIIAAQRKA